MTRGAKKPALESERFDQGGENSGPCVACGSGTGGSGPGSRDGSAAARPAALPAP